MATNIINFKTYEDNTYFCWLCSVDYTGYKGGSTPGLPTSSSETEGLLGAIDNIGKTYIKLPQHIVLTPDDTATELSEEETEDESVKDASRQHASYGIWKYAFLGAQQLFGIIIPSSVEYISDYAFEESSIRHIYLQTSIMPVFSIECFTKSGISSTSPMTIEVCKGYSSYAQAALSQHKHLLDQGKIIIKENDVVLETKSIIPSLRYAGAAIETVNFTGVQEIGYMPYLYHSFPSNKAEGQTTFTGLTTDTTKTYWTQNNNTVLGSNDVNNNGYLVIGASANKNQKFDGELDKNIGQNAFLYQSFTDNSVTLKEGITKIDNLGFQGTSMSLEIEDLSSISYIANNAFLHANIEKLKISQSSVSAKYHCYICTEEPGNIIDISLSDAGYITNDISTKNAIALLLQQNPSTKNTTYTLINAFLCCNDSSKSNISSLINKALSSTYAYRSLNEKGKLVTLNSWKITHVAHDCFTSDNWKDIPECEIEIPENIAYIGFHAFGSIPINTIEFKSRNTLLTLEDYSFHPQTNISQISGWDGEHIKTRSSLWAGKKNPEEEQE